MSMGATNILPVLRRCATTLSVFASTLVVVTFPATAQPAFEGKTIRLVIASTPSGPTDTTGRVFVPYLSKHLPGKPNIIVENRPGAAGVVAANYMHEVAKPDGLTIGVLFGMVTQGFMRGPGIRYDPNKLQIIGAVSATQVLLTRHDIGLKRPQDLLNPGKSLVLASLGTGSTTDAANRLFLEIIGAKYKLVTGYPGQAETILALARDEANLANASHTTYLARRDSIRKEGIYDAFLQRGELRADGTYARNKQLPDIPTMVEVIQQLKPEALKSVDFAAYRSILGALAVHYSFVVPPATDPRVIETLRKAFSAALDDPEARQKVPAMLQADYEFVSGTDSQKIVQDLHAEFEANKGIGSRLNEIMSTK